MVGVPLLSLDESKDETGAVAVVGVAAGFDVMVSVEEALKRM